SGLLPRARTGCAGSLPGCLTGPRAWYASSRPMSGVALARRAALSPKMWPSRTSPLPWDSPSSGWRTAGKTCWAFMAGGIESALCMRRTMDLSAKAPNLDPAEVRRKNFISPEAFPYQTPTGLTYDSGNYAQALDRALELADYASWRDRARRRQSPQAPYIGIGLATVIKMSGGSGESRAEEAWITVEPSGHIVAR